jgi:OmpA-OmpF porin, OOP family
MKRMLIALLTTLIGSVAVASELDVPTRYSWVGGHLSEHFWDINSRGQDRLTPTTLAGLQLGKRFSPNWSVQAWWERNNARFDISRTRADLSIVHGSARYHFAETRWAGFEPYAGIGAGRSRLTSAGTEDDQTLITGEAGAQRRLRPHWLFDIGVRPMYGFDNEQTDVQAYLGLNLLFDIQ